MSSRVVVRIAVTLALWALVIFAAWRGMWIPLVAVLALSLLVLLAFSWPIFVERRRARRRSDE
jgi:hypothetical protein